MKSLRLDVGWVEITSNHQYVARDYLFGVANQLTVGVDHRTIFIISQSVPRVDWFPAVICQTKGCWSSWTCFGDIVNCFPQSYRWNSVGQKVDTSLRQLIATHERHLMFLSRWVIYSEAPTAQKGIFSWSKLCINFRETYFAQCKCQIFNGKHDKCFFGEGRHLMQN